MNPFRTATDNAPSGEDDPFLAALLAAEVDDEPLTEEDRDAMRRGDEEIARGEAADWPTVRAPLFGNDAPHRAAG